MLIDAVEREVKHLIDGGDELYVPVRCPFCGDVASSTEFSRGLWFVQCIKCHACGPTRTTSTQAISAWRERS